MPNYIELTDFELEYLKVRLQLRKLMKEAWRREELSKCKFIYYLFCGKFGSPHVIQTYRYNCPSDIVFPTWETAGDAVLLIGEDRLKKYYFCIEETEDPEDEQEI